jgi:hypothetical protein
METTQTQDADFERELAAMINTDDQTTTELKTLNAKMKMLFKYIKQMRQEMKSMLILLDSRLR